MTATVSQAEGTTTRSSSNWCPCTVSFLGEGSPTKIDYGKKMLPLFYPLYWRTQLAPRFFGGTLNPEPLCGYEMVCSVTEWPGRIARWGCSGCGRAARAVGGHAIGICAPCAKWGGGDLEFGSSAFRRRQQPGAAAAEESLVHFAKGC